MTSSQPLTVGLRKDCFALEESPFVSKKVSYTCTALKKLYCKTEICKFYKSKGEVGDYE